MYSGLVFGSFGIAIISGSPVRTLITALLAVLLNAKARPRYA